MEQQGEIILYQPDESVRMEVRIEDETVWLTQAQIAELFETKRQAITKHLKNIFQSGELNENSVCSILELTASDGKSYKTKTYNLDAIISVGYRVNSKNATLFRRWASQVLKDYLLKGHVINQRISNLEQRVDAKFLSYDMQLTRLNEKDRFFCPHLSPSGRRNFLRRTDFRCIRFRHEPYQIRQEFPYPDRQLYR